MSTQEITPQPVASNLAVSPSITLRATVASQETKNLVTKIDQKEKPVAPSEIENIAQLEQIIELTPLPKSQQNYTKKDFERALTYGKPESIRQEQINVQYSKEKPPEDQPNLYKKQTEDDEKGTNASETMTHQEANGKLQDIQYAQVTGNMQLLDLQERRRFANWAQYNPELLSLFHNIHSITGDVDYSRTF